MPGEAGHVSSCRMRRPLCLEHCASTGNLTACEQASACVPNGLVQAKSRQLPESQQLEAGHLSRKLHKTSWLQN